MNTELTLYLVLIVIQQKKMIVDPKQKSNLARPASSSLAPTNVEFSFPSKHYQHQKPTYPQHRYDCTCQEPLSVTLPCDNNMDLEVKKKFIENLRIHGWSPIVVPEAPHSSPSQDDILAIFRRRRQRGDKYTTDKNGDVVFIAAESGSSEGGSEPKESLEVKLSNCSTNNFQNDKSDDEEERPGKDGDEATVKKWCQTLSWIAHRICKVMLDIPENTFLPSDPNESLDLLRIFHYYAVGAEKFAESSSPTLGSSEHTDWGSFTVVWQDSVGGLQTYCRACKKWIDVRAAANTGSITMGSEPSYRWQCIVHVGDMASLALDRSANTRSLSENITAVATSISHPWPSPKHRVKSHPLKERVSLVYFGYPPPVSSLRQIQKNLDKGWLHFSTRGQRLPLGDYYLLRNQSSTVETTANDANGENSDQYSKEGHLCRTIWNLPIQDIVRLKWEQVSRDG